MEIQGNSSLGKQSSRSKKNLVLLQAMKEDPPLDARCRDKFLVQSGPVNPDQISSSVASIVSLI